MQLDRALTLTVFKALKMAPSRGDRRSLPVLMYHSISEDCGEHVSAYYQTVTSPAMFAAQMTLLKQEGYQVVSLATGLESLRVTKSESPSDPSRFVAVTFDDGFRDFYTSAFPVLQQHGFSATMYLPTGFIQQKPASFKSRFCLSWNEIRELHRAGIEFGSHTVTHPRLVDLEWANIQHELRVSKASIEERLGVATKSFAYPYAYPQANGCFVERFRDELESAGYDNCVTTIIGRVCRGDDAFCLRRLPVNSHDDDALLEAKLEGAYDWMASPQLILKTCKQWFR